MSFLLSVYYPDQDPKPQVQNSDPTFRILKKAFGSLRLRIHNIVINSRNSYAERVVILKEQCNAPNNDEFTYTDYAPSLRINVLTLKMPRGIFSCMFLNLTTENSLTLLVLVRKDMCGYCAKKEDTHWQKYTLNDHDIIG
jgi:hypothetical protein